jgi:uncharacterized membrane protein
MRISTPPTRVIRIQRGSIVFPAAIALFVGVMLLGGAQMGYLFFAKRDMQKAADLAALTGAQVLNNGLTADCTAAEAAAQQAAKSNGGSDVAVDASCWRWDPENNTADARHLASPAAGQGDNAVLVRLSRDVKSFFPFLSDSNVGAQAVGARPGEPIATFTVGTTLLTGKKQPGNLINLLAASGLSLDSATLAGYDGLANVNVTPSGLLKALGIPVDSNITVGALNSKLAAAQIDVAQMLTAIVNAAGQSGLADSTVTLANQALAKVNLTSASIQLGSTTQGRSSSLFAMISAANGQSALDTQVNALDLVNSALSVATAGHAIQLDAGNPQQLNVGPVNASIAMQADVIEPAQIGIGGVGATAYNAQVRFLANLNLSVNLLILNLNVNLPLAVDAIQAKGEITALCDQPDSSGRYTATIAVTAPIANVCLGGVDTSQTFGVGQGCGAAADSSNPNSHKVAVALKTTAGASLLAFQLRPVTLPLLHGDGSVTLHEGETQSVSNNLPIGSTLSDALSTGLNDVLAPILSGALAGATGTGGNALNQQSSAVAQSLWDSTASTDNNCNASTLDAAGYQCRNDRWQAALTQVKSSANNLSDFVGSTNSGVLGAVGGLAGGLVNTVTGLVNGILGAVGVKVVSNQCASQTVVTVLGAQVIGTYGGTTQGCVNEINNTLKKTNTASATDGTTSTASNLLLTLLGSLVTQLQPAFSGLNGLGSQLAALLQNTLGISIDTTDVHLSSLQCNGKGVQLVY